MYGMNGGALPGVWKYRHGEGYGDGASSGRNSLVTGPI